MTQEVKPQISEARKANYPFMLKMLQHLRMNKSISDRELHPVIDQAYSEAKSNGAEAITMFKRVLLHIGDISRQHNLLKTAGIQSTKGGAGERANFRSVMRWWERNIPDFYANMKIFSEFTVMSNLIYDEIRTDRMKGTLKSIEYMNFDVSKVAAFFAKEIKTSKNPLIAKHLPNYATGTVRYTKKNGKTVRRNKTAPVLEREARARTFVKVLCKELEWNIDQYKEYRKKQNTPEQLFSSGEIVNLSEDLVMQLFDKMTASQRFRVAHMITDKDALGHLQPKQKWQEIGLLYIKWEANQTKVAEKIRETVDPDDRAKVAKDFKVKATGMQTIDILAKIYQGKLTADQANNTYQALLEKMDLVGNVFPIVDGSGSMSLPLGDPRWRHYIIEYDRSRAEPFDEKYASIRLFDIAAAMCIAFATRNPNENYKNSFGWFSKNFKIVGASKFINKAPNQYVKGNEYIVRSDGQPVISETYPFVKNLQRIVEANPGDIGPTNIGAAVEYFVDFHKETNMSVEELPSALLFITDNEGNTGMSPPEFMGHAASIGWHPLVIFWGLKVNKMNQYGNIPNCLFIGGFNESVLGQILRGIKSGSILPESELWSINDDKRYAILS